jgi:FAD dependent oxidoreductase TIGR03364
MVASPAASYDCAIVGAGIIGLAHALVAARAGLRTVVIDRESRAIGASIRNFGFVTVTGQQAGDCWRRARRARDIWAEVAPQAGIAVHHRGLLFAARRPEALAVLEEFAASPMGEGCRMLTAAEAASQGALRPDLAGALASPHELRVESRDAIPRLTAWLRETRKVEIRTSTAVTAVAPGRITTTAGTIAAPRIIVCPGTDLRTLFPEVFARRAVTLCKLHMLRVADPGWRLPAAVMSDLGLVRYLGYADCPSLPRLAARLRAEQPGQLANGVHLIVVQGADGSLIVGDSHHYSDSPDPFQPEEVDALILDEFRAVLDLPRPEVVERWIGVYPSGPETAFIEAPMDGVRLVSVTSGTGASTAFGLAEDTFATWEQTR